MSFPLCGDVIQSLVDVVEQDLQKLHAILLLIVVKLRQAMSVCCLEFTGIVAAVLPAP